MKRFLRFSAGVIVSLALSSGAHASVAAALNPQTSEMGAPSVDPSLSRGYHFAGGNLYATGIALAIQSTPSDNAGSPYESETGFGFGVGAGWRQEILGLELGYQQVDRRFAVGGDRISTEYHQVPGLIRLWLGDSLSFGFGPALSFGTGTVVVASKDGSIRNLSLQDAALKSVDVGFIMNTQVQLLPANALGVTLGAQYAFSLLNHATSGDFRYSDLQVYAGIRVGSL